MKQGTFFFVADNFFTKHDPDRRLMRNKEGVHDRPCFYAFPDKKEPNIYWCVPISSRIEKFEKIVQNKIAKQIEKGYKTPICNTIRFGEVLGQKRAFLIQNMFPITAAYISAIYMDKNTKAPVTIAPATEKDIVTNAKDILKLVFRGYSNLVFSDIKRTYADLRAELYPEQQKENEITTPSVDRAKAVRPDKVCPVDPSRKSMTERMAEAQAEADRRNSSRTVKQVQPDKKRDPER